MMYSLKWIKENLGITPDMIKNYERKKLLNKKVYQNPRNNYREYSESDIDTLWVIKTLIGIGYTVEEIKQLINDENFDFYKSITEKVKKLEENYHKTKEYYEFAKTIKLTGQIPTVKKYGSIKFDDFLKFAKENWNFNNDPKAASFFKLADKIKTSSIDDIELSDIKNFEELISDLKEMKVGCSIDAYQRLICELKDYNPSSEIVQMAVKLLYEFVYTIIDEVDKRKFTPNVFVRNTISQFLAGDIADMNVQTYGRDGCIFIAQALACFGGFEDIYQI